METNTKLNDFNYKTFFKEIYELDVQSPTENATSIPKDLPTENVKHGLSDPDNPAQDQIELNEAFEELNRVFEELKKLESENKLDPLIAIDKLAPSLEKIAKYSSKGLKWVAKAADYTVENLPCEFLDADTRIKGIVDYFKDKVGDYGQITKVINMALFLVRYNTTRKLETLIRKKTTALKAIKELKIQIESSLKNRLNTSDEPINTSDEPIIFKLEKDIKSLEEEILKANEQLQKELKKLDKNALKISLSAFNACLKLAKRTCSQGTRKYLSYIIWCVSMALDVLGCYEGIKANLGNLIVRAKLFKELNTLNKEIAFLETRKNTISPENKAHIKACEKAILILKTRKAFLQNVRMDEAFKLLIIEGLDLISSLSSTLGTIGALFAVTTAIAGTLSTFAIWIAVLGFLIKTGCYYYDNPLKLRMTTEEKKRKDQDDLLSEIIELRVETKKLNAKRFEILESLYDLQIKDLQANSKEEREKYGPMIDKKVDERVIVLSKIKETDLKLVTKIQEYWDKYEIDLYREKNKSDKKPKVKKEDVKPFEQTDSSDFKVQKEKFEIQEKINDKEENDSIPEVNASSSFLDQQVHSFFDAANDEKNEIQEKHFEEIKAKVKENLAEKMKLIELLKEKLDDKVKRKREKIKDLKKEKEEVETSDVELSGGADLYDQWANQIMKDMKDNEYRQIIGHILTKVQQETEPKSKIDLEEDALKAFNQIENFIRTDAKIMKGDWRFLVPDWAKFLVPNAG